MSLNVTTERLRLSSGLQHNLHTRTLRCRRTNISSHKNQNITVRDSKKSDCSVQQSNDKRVFFKQNKTWKSQLLLAVLQDYNALAHYNFRFSGGICWSYLLESFPYAMSVFVCSCSGISISRSTCGDVQAQSFVELYIDPVSLSEVWDEVHSEQLVPD